MSGNTNEIRTDVNAILDCVDYVCQRLDISQEELDKAYDFFLNEVFAPGIKDGISKALFGEKHRKRYSEYKRNSYNTIRKTPRTAKDDWSYELDHLYFNTREEAKLVVERIESHAVDFDEVTVGYVFELMDESCSYESEYYGWTADMILYKIQILPCTNAKKVQVILPPPVRLKV